MSYLKIQFMEIDNLMDKHRYTLKARSSQIEYYSKFHRLLDTKYIVYHQEFVVSKRTPEYKCLSREDQDFCKKRWKETLERCKKELENYENNRSVDAYL